MFSKDKIISYQLVGEELNGIKEELDEFYKLDIPFANPFDTKYPHTKMEHPRLDVSYATFEYDVIKMHNLTKLHNAILLYFSNVSDEFCMPDVNWATDMKVGSIAAEHSHGPVYTNKSDAFYCGVYYHDVDPSDVNIQFLLEDIWTDIEMKVGKLLFWPAEYLHRIPLKTSNVTRRSFSFNLYKR